MEIHQRLFILLIYLIPTPLMGGAGGRGLLIFKQVSDFCKKLLLC